MQSGYECIYLHKESVECVVEVLKTPTKSHIKAENKQVLYCVKESALPTWACCAQKVLCIQLSSAVAERKFSLLQVFGGSSGFSPPGLL